MNNVAKLHNSDLDVIRRTVAKDCNNSEFDLFMAQARSYGLDPFRRQIIPIIFSKNDAKKRSMTVVYSRDGLRCIAARCGDYRPASEPAIVEYDETLKSPTNPKGIISIVVKLWKQDNKGEWYPVIGEADWDEYAPIVDEWAYDQETNSRKPTGNKILDASGQWAKMPKVMLTKCAEAQALRAGWPEQFSGVYGEEEMQKAVSDDLTASEMAEAGRVERIEKSLKFKDSIGFNFGDGVTYIAAGQCYDEWQKQIEKHSDNLQIILTLRDQNREPLKHFWAIEPDAALSLKKQFEGIEQSIADQEVTA